jgi:U3 small nucleolar RNA-associated protein 6
MSYLEYVRQAKATNKFKAVLTSAIRLHPTKSELWLYAARWALEVEADMNGARSYMQRGTRFCTRSKELWIEYAKLEMVYLAKITMRRRILGLDVGESVEASVSTEETIDDTSFAASEDVIAIPDFKTLALRPSMAEGVEIDSEAARDPMTTPALNGAIPLAIFDAARKQLFFCPAAAEDFFDMFASFAQVRCLPRILQHILDSMMESYPGDLCTCSCYIRQPVLRIESTSPEFPRAIGSTLDRLKQMMAITKDKVELSKKIKACLSRILSLDELDPGIQTVLRHTIRKLE